MFSLKGCFGSSEYFIPYILFVRDGPFPRSVEFNSRQLFHKLRTEKIPILIPCCSLGPDVVTNEELFRMWTDVVLTPEETKAIEALNLVVSTTVERVAAIVKGFPRSKSDSRRFVVTTVDHS